MTELRAVWYGVLLPTGSRHFCFLQNFHTNSEAHSTSQLMGTVNFLPGVKRPGREIDLSSFSEEVKNQWSSTSTHPACLNGVGRDNFGYYWSSRKLLG